MKTVVIEEILNIEGEQKITLNGIGPDGDTRIILDRRLVLQIFEMARKWPGLGLEVKAIMSRQGAG